LSSRRFGPYTLQAAIAALHAEARSPQETNWTQNAGFYEIMLRAAPSPVVELNRAVAIAMRDGPRAGLTRIDGILGRGALQDYQPAHAARADLLRRLGNAPQAREAYGRALQLTAQGPPRRFIEQRIRDLDRKPRPVSK
jgi:RNA polymerase sigma-70 factor (ECF subfamily)